MPGGKTKFQNSWLEKVDNNGNKLSKWCRKDNKNEYAGFCFVCSKQISCANAGSNQLLNHADGQKHKESMKSRVNCAQGKFFVPDPKSSTQGGGDIATKGNIVQLQPMSHRDHVQRAEILWALKIAASGYSSCDNIAELFQAMFPGQIANDFTMSKSKISYLISDALGPYFRQELSKRIQESKCMYTVQYDETGNAQDKKQCDVLVRFWNEQQGEVSTMFLKSLLFGHAKGKDVGQALLNALTEENVPVEFLLFLGSDGPNVNKTIWTYINSHKKSHGYSELVQFIPCTVHVVHNSFRKGLNVFGEDAEELAIDLFRWFKTHSCQREDYSATLEDLGMDDEMFIRHVECRWLTLLPALERVERNWEAAKQYFLKDLPRAIRENKTDKYLLKNFRYQRICVKLKSTSTLVEVQFLVNSAPVFNNFLTLFQKQEPPIHILYEESTQLLETFMLRFMKQEVVKGTKGSKLAKLDIGDVNNCADLQDMEIGGNTKTTLSKVGSPKEKEIILHNIRKFYQEVAGYLAKNLPIGVPVVKYAQCLHPDVREHEEAYKCFRNLVQCLPNVKKEEVSVIIDEWKMYMSEKIPEKEVCSENDEPRRIDHYWNNVFGRKNASGSMKYSFLKRVVTACLCISHGNADVERSLSVNKKLLTAERALMSKETLNGLRITRDAVKFYGGSVTAVPITRDMRDSVANAHAKYIKKLEDEKTEKTLKERREKEAKEQKEEEEKLKKLNEERKRNIHEREKEVKQTEQELKDELTKARNIFEEANNRLSETIKNKDFVEMNIAQGLMEIAKTDLEKATASLEKSRGQRSDIDAKRRKLMDSYMGKDKFSSK